MNDLDMLARARQSDDRIAFHKAELAGLPIHGPVDTMGTGGWSRVLAWRDYFRSSGFANRNSVERPAYNR